MEKIKELTKNTLFKLKEANLLTTPENYFVEFRNQAQLLDVEVSEFELFNKLKKALTLNEIESAEINTFNDLATILAKRVNEEELKELITIFEEILRPFSDLDLVKEIEEFILKTLETPKNIIASETINSIKEIANKRVDSDRKILKDKTNDIIKLTSLMSRYFDKTLNESENSSEDILKIKDELITLNMSEASQRELKVVQSKLVDTIHKIENSIKTNCKIINDQKIQFNSLNEQIRKLQEELSIAKEEKETDFLTNVFNRRAYHHEIEKIEKNYTIFNNNYAIVFYDIDNFKKINDEYGHTCGDAVLKNFAGILKKLTRTEDIIARYGGEEFIALINYEKEEEVVGYAKRVKKAISSTNFIYREELINIKFSAGVTFRNKYESYSDAKRKADEILHELIGRAHNIVRHPDMDSSVFKEMWHTIKDLKSSWKGIIKNRKKDGTAYWVKTIINPILDGHNNVMEYIGIRTDITDMEETKEELKAQYDISQNNFQEVMHLSKLYENAIEQTNIILRADKNRVINYANDQFYKISGLTKKELVGNN